MSRRGCCAKCTAPFVNEEAILACGQLYHANHLCCNYCNTRICYIEESFIVDCARIACIRCFHKLSPKCHKCRKSVVNDIDGRLYHLNCFKCARCHRILDVEYFEDEDGRPLDRDCLWGDVLMDHIIRDTDNVIPSGY
uniref:LIM zinc-binding domain-containing protein n=1 Tax=Elaeophora elaphi TaxID=1147741 RepID=A0A0R3RFC8_9BILA